MPSGIVESATWDPFIYVPEDGEAANKDSLKDNFVQGLTNRTAFLHKPAASGSAQYPLKERSITRFISAAPTARPAENWSEQGTILEWTTLVASSYAMQLIFPLDVPDGCTVTAFQVIVTGGPGHTATLPSTMPAISFYAYDLNGGATILGSATDPSATTTALEMRHPIVMYVDAPYGIINKSMYRYCLKFASEFDAGSNAKPGLIFYSAAVIFTVTEQDPGAG